MGPKFDLAVDLESCYIPGFSLKAFFFDFGEGNIYVFLPYMGMLAILFNGWNHSNRLLIPF